jgi:signal transduction histidine kinase
MGERDQREVLGDIAQQAQRLGSLLSNLLALARADEGQLALEQEPLWLDRLSADAVTSLLPLANERGLILQTGALEPALVEGDLARLLLVLLNLIENALTYTPADDGAGAADRALAGMARRNERGGTGLGLGIAQTLVEARGGAITVSSSEGVGSRFIVMLPLSSRQPLQS